MTTPSNSPPISSTAETILAQAQAQVEAQVEAQPIAPDTGDDAVEVVDTGDNGAPRTRKLSWNDALKQVPPDIAKLMREMQGDYTRKTQELSEQRKDFLRERESLMKGAKTLQDRELPEYDPFNEDTIRARIENEVNKRLREVLEPMQAEYEVMAAEDSYKSFVSEHPEFATDTGLRSEVQALLEGNPNLDLVTAYWAAKGKAAKYASAQTETRKSAERRAAKEAAMTGTAPPRRGSVTSAPDRSQLKRMSNAEILAAAQAMSRGR